MGMVAQLQRNCDKSSQFGKSRITGAVLTIESMG
jgi:hypothetical protein